MSARRTMILVVAMVIGLVAAVALYSYASGAETRAYGDAELVQVFVVKTDIVKGTQGDQAIGQKLIGRDEIPTEFRPGNALSELDPIKGKVAITDLAKDQVIVDGLFVAPNQVPGGAFSSQIEKGQVAVTVSVDQVRGVGGNLLPGDKVNIIVTVTQPGATPAEGAPAEGATEDANKTVHYLYQNVKILAIGQNAAPGVGETETATNPGSDLITFMVPPEAAQRIVFAGSDRLYLTLVPKDNEVQPLPPLGFGDLFPNRLCPYSDDPDEC